MTARESASRPDVPAPTASGHAANKGYVDAKVDDSSTVFNEWTTDANATTSAPSKRTTAIVVAGELSNLAASVGTYVEGLTQDDIGDGTTYKQYSGTEKTKLSGVATGATANSSNATLLARANHTGSQSASTISDFNTAADARVTAGITGKLDTTAAPELIRDTIGTALVAGANVTITPNDAGDTITIAATGGSGGGGGGSGFGAYAAMPAANTVSEGYLYVCSDVDSVYRSTGTDWALVGPGPTFGAIPQSGWTTVGSGSVAASKGHRLLTFAGSGPADALRGEVRALSPGSNYRVVMELDSQMPIVNGPGYGLLLSDGTKYVFFGFQVRAGTPLFLQVQLWNTSTSIASSPFENGTSSSLALANSRFISIRDDGTNRYYELSNNGIDWMKVFSHARTTHLTATMVGYCANSYGSGYTAYVRAKQFAII